MQANGSRNYLTPAEANAEFEAEAKKWTLPSGWHWPPEPLQQTASDGAAITYGLNYGRVEATRFWACAWKKELQSAADAASRDRAIKQLERLRETAYYAALDDKASEESMLAAARSGDFTPLAKFVELNCPWDKG